MTTKKTLATAALLMLAAAPFALAHDSNSDTGTEPVSPNTRCWTTQNPHDYGSSGSVVTGTQSTGTTFGGAVQVSDYNVGGCGGHARNGHSWFPPWGDIEGGIGGEIIGLIWPDDDARMVGALASDAVAGGCGEACRVAGPGFGFDGDLEYGLGGGFFPAGIYAADSTCDYGFTAHHGPNFHVHSTVPDEGPGFLASFTVGSDPTPPTLVPSTDVEDDDGFDCITDGSVTPDLDLDDCMESFVHAGTTTCLPGGDGGWWVWVDCVAVTEGDDVSLGLTDADGDGIPDGANPRTTPPSGATGQCSAQGHIYSS